MEDNTFGDFLSTSLDGLPAFFTNGSVDDAKYESLLEDLRAHDLLGPSDTQEDTSGKNGGRGTGMGSSLFFNDAFSAVFMGNFTDSTAKKTAATTTASTPRSTGKPAAPPPGFAQQGPPGLAPSETDLKWARGQQEFSMIKEKFKTPTSGGQVFSPERSVDGEAIDESQVPSLRSLGLDDDDAIASFSGPTSMASPPPGMMHSLPRSPPQGYLSPPPHGSPPPGSPPRGPWQMPPPPHHPAHPHHPSPPPHMMPPPHHMPPPPPPPHMHGRGPPPPSHMYGRGPPPPPFGPGFAPPPFARGPPSGGPPMGPPRFKMMTERDINFVIQQQMKQIRSSDPFSDDYYFHNYVQKRNRAAAAIASSSSSGGPRPPLPSWKLEHVKSIDPRDAQRANQSNQWASENQVLGRNVKTSLYRPKQLLNLSEANKEQEERVQEQEQTQGEEVEESCSPKKKTTTSTMETTKVLGMPAQAKQQSVFGNETWFKRQRIDKGMQYLLSLQDARHILDARGINVQRFHSIDDQDIDPALVDLRQKTTRLLLELAAILGVCSVENPSNKTNEIKCDVPTLEMILSSQKGKRLLSRALPLLHPSARFVLLADVIHFVFGPQYVGLFSNQEMGALEHDVIEADEKLCQALVLILLYHPPTPPADILTNSLAKALEGHTVDTLRLVLHNRPRAEVLQALLQKGAQATSSGAASVDIKNKWTHYQELFVKIATAIKQTSPNP